MSAETEKKGGARRASERDARAAAEAEQTRKAQADLDQLRHQAGGALSGRELAERFGLDPDAAEREAPPLDWRLTPRNVILQLVAVAAFAAVMWFMATLLIDSITLLFGGASGDGGS